MEWDQYNAARCIFFKAILQTSRVQSWSPQKKLFSFHCSPLTHAFLKQLKNPDITALPPCWISTQACANMKTQDVAMFGCQPFLQQSHPQRKQKTYWNTEFTTWQQTFNAKYCLISTYYHFQYHHASPDTRTAMTLKPKQSHKRKFISSEQGLIQEKQNAGKWYLL